MEITVIRDIKSGSFKMLPVGSVGLYQRMEKRGVFRYAVVDFGDLEIWHLSPVTLMQMCELDGKRIDYDWIKNQPIIEQVVT